MMDEKQRPRIAGVPSGVPGLDEIIGDGGIPEYSFTVIAGGPGAGKTTFAQQFVFANATVERPALYFTVLGEPPLKMMRYLQDRSFFDTAAINRSVRFVNLSKHAVTGDVEAVYQAIVQELESSAPGIVVVDSFRSMQQVAASDSHLATFVQRLALDMSSWQATTFLVGEYVGPELESAAVFTIADAVLWLEQTAHLNTIVRTLRVVKMRGRAAAPGLHSYRITADGVEIFGSPPKLTAPRLHPVRSERLNTGVPGLDDMLNGGLPSAGPVLICGPAGTGKTTLASHILAAAARRGDRPVLALFEETPERYLARAGTAALGIPEMESEGQLSLLHVPGLDLSVAETLQKIRDAVAATGARAVIIDNLDGLELSLEPNSRREIRQALYRLLITLTSMGLFVISTLELEQSFERLQFSQYSISFLADVIIGLRYVEVEGALRKVISVVKLRDSAHSDAFHMLEIGASGARIGAQLQGTRGVLNAVAQPAATPLDVPAEDGLGRLETRLLGRLAERGRSNIEDLIAGSEPSARAVRRALRHLSALGLITRLRQKNGDVVYRLGKRRTPTRS